MQKILSTLTEAEKSAAQIEPAPLSTLAPLPAPLWTREEIARYDNAAQSAQSLALQHNSFTIQEKKMNAITDNPKTSLAGIIAAMPLFTIAITLCFAGEVGGGVAHAVAGLGVLVGLLQASDATQVAKALATAIPKPEKPQ